MSEDRHGRTNLLLDKYCACTDLSLFHSKPVLITGDERLSGSDGCLTAKTLTNLTCRFADNVSIDLPAGYEKLEDELICMGESIGATMSHGRPSNPSVVASVGNTEAEGCFKVSMSSDGWISCVECGGDLPTGRHYGSNPLGAMGAGCLGAAEIFDHLLAVTGSKKYAESSTSRSIRFSFLDYEKNGANLDFPGTLSLDRGTLLVGAGAVGSAVIYCLGQIPGVTGSVTVMDNDIYEGSNLNRCVTAFQDDLGTPKADISTRYSTQRLTFVPTVTSYEAASKLDCEFPLVISTVDNNDARFAIQNDLPETIIHGATGGPIAAASVLNLGENACMHCIFGNGPTGEAPDRNGEECSTISAKIENGAATVSATASFVSFFSGLCLSAEIVKRAGQMNNFPLQNGRNFLQYNLLKPFYLPPSSYRKMNSNCQLCSDPIILERYNSKWRR